MNSWPACHELEPSAIEDPSCRGAMYIKSVESSNVLPQRDGVFRRGRCQLKCRPRHLTMIQNDELHLQKPSRAAE
ncbi:uncharacterized protein TNCV_2031341 [Trichonephila clavipes]|nr:uncharacterized protein TNCV_2031341 [Trichonephila clavipes]